MSSKNYTNSNRMIEVNRSSEQQPHTMHVDISHLSSRGKAKPQLTSLMESKASMSQKLSVSEFDNSSLVVMSEPDSYKAGPKIQTNINHNSYQYPIQMVTQTSKYDGTKQHNNRQAVQQNNRYNINSNTNNYGVQNVQLAGVGSHTAAKRMIIPDVSSSEESHATLSSQAHKTEGDNNYVSKVAPSVIFEQRLENTNGSSLEEAQATISNTNNKDQIFDTIYSSFSNDVLKDGVIKKSTLNCKLEPSQDYQGLYIQANQLQNNQKQYVWLSQQYFSRVFKFPIIKKDQSPIDLLSAEKSSTSTKTGLTKTQATYGQKNTAMKQQVEMTFGKCTSNIKESLNQIHAISPFKKSLQVNSSNQKVQQKDQQMSQQQMEQHEARQLTAAKKRNELATSFQSEDVCDTLEELPVDDRLIAVILDDENIQINEGPHLGTQHVKQDPKKEDRSICLSPINEELNSVKSQSPTDKEQKPVEGQNSLPISQNDKVFALQIDDNIHDTSFDTINSEHLFVTSTEDHFPMSAQKTNIHGSVPNSNPVSNFNSNNNAKNSSIISNQQHPHQQQQTVECIQAHGDDSMIENELKQINQNLNTFTVEHFNNLRQQIQAVGFFKAANKAKREFNLITSDSTTTLNSVKDEYNEVGRQGTEEAKMNARLHNLYANNTTASKNLLHVNDARKKHNQFEPENKETAYNVSGLSPLIRKLAICEQKDKSNSNMSQIEVIHSSSCSGFNSTPLLAYSDQECDSKGYLDKSYQASLIMNQLLSPQILESFIQTPITWITCGFENCVALTVYGILASWGYGASGCLGHNNYTSYTSPKLLVDGDLQGQFITYVESGGYHSAAISQDGQLFMWGRSDVGQVGLPKDQLLEDEMGYVALAPKHIKHFSDINRKVKQVALGEAHTVVLDEQGHVYTFGWGELGQLGISALSQNKNNQFQINKIKFFETFPCERVSAGAVFSLALTKQKGRIYAWGSGQNGQLGLGSVKSCDFPVFIDFLQNERIIDIECGDSHALALSDKGTVYGWGQGISQSQSLIKSLRDSSIINQNQPQIINYPGENDISNSMMIANSGNNVNQLEVICFFPRILSEVDIAHTFLIKKKQPLVLQQQENFNTQNSNSGIGVTEQASSQSSSHSKNAIKRLYTNSGRNMPSNHTICEVSERDSELDERSQIMKRQELKQIILTTQGGAQMKSISQQANAGSNNRSQNWQTKSLKAKPKIEMVVRRSPSPKHDSVSLQAMTGTSAAAIAFGRKKSVQLSQMQSSSLQQQQQQQYMKLDNPNRMQSKQSKVVMLLAETDKSTSAPYSTCHASSHITNQSSQHQDVTKIHQGAPKSSVGKEDIIKKLQEFTQGNIFNDVLSKTQKINPTGIVVGDHVNQSSLNSSILHSSASQGAQQKGANTNISYNNHSNNTAGGLNSNHININDNVLSHTSKISSNGAPLPPPSIHKTHSKQQSRLQTYSNSIIESFSTKRFKMPSDMNSYSVLGYQSNNSSRISIRDADQCNRTQRIKSPQPDGSVLSKFSTNKYSSPKLDTTASKYKTPLNSSSQNATAAAYQTNTTMASHTNATNSNKPTGCQTVLGKDVLKDLPSTTRNKNFQIKFSSGTNSYKKTAAGTGAAATSNTVYNMNDTSKFSTSSNKSNMSTLISPSRKFIHKKNQSMGSYAFNENSQQNNQKPKGPKIGYGGSGQQNQAGAIPVSGAVFTSASSRVSPKSGRRPAN